mmetsp:Transcript_26896/g.62463  ORF Transcript_26896/g.62463 Transcript_26896/m.62463 type:complete len:146 (-) Transcript_26896:234-671(-)|eukprot:CAMPEP_0116843126 /NCGR_PEP_ID=MMETSP0418-20121206/11910_1 /TAXON_ID=1158023 /ORGANISM="Astrosyne radiata, Strain 13vi08-1A" /LENGTH=145 /DNA_ID=CAMNT_0004473835 /DNA_START=95 /DNA_END=532 /DNA_ORIENTATION=+
MARLLVVSLLLLLLLLVFVVTAQRTKERGKRSLGTENDRLAEKRPTSFFQSIFEAFSGTPNLTSLFGDASEISLTGPWDECVGFTPEDCCEWIQATVSTITECVTMDIVTDRYTDMEYRERRVRVWMDPTTGLVVLRNGIGPKIG